MMGLLGIPFVKSDGEAEAMCAWLNENDVCFFVSCQPIVHSFLMICQIKTILVTQICLYCS